MLSLFVRGGFVGSTLMNLSKAYDCLPHDLLLAKPQDYGLRIKIGSTFRDWTNAVKGIPQGSILGLLFFSIFINDLFFPSAKCEICNFADDNSLYSSGINLENIFSNLIQDMQNVYSSMKANSDKFQFIILGNTGLHSLQISDITIKSGLSVTPLGITINSKLKFKEHINNFVKKHIINYMPPKDYY